jgi:hypothetical protein
MRYCELFEAPARPWKQYKGLRHRIRLIRTVQVEGGDKHAFASYAFFGDIVTGRQEVLQGQFVSVLLPDGDELVGEHPRSLHAALKDVCKEAERKGWKVLALGRMPEFRETGLSVNTGYGFHPAVPDRHVHMLEVPPSDIFDE